MSENLPVGHPDKQYFEVDKIPEIVLEELKRNFKNVNFSTYGQAINENCRTMAFQSVETVEEDTNGVMLDPETFEPRIATHVDKVRSFKIRGVFDNESVDVYAIGSIFAIRQRPDTVIMTAEEFKEQQ